MAWQLRVGLSALTKTKVCISASMQGSSQVFVTPAPGIPRPLLTSAGTCTQEIDKHIHMSKENKSFKNTSNTSKLYLLFSKVQTIAHIEEQPTNKYKDGVCLSYNRQ